MVGVVVLSVPSQHHVLKQSVHSLDLFAEVYPNARSVSAQARHLGHVVVVPLSVRVLIPLSTIWVAVALSYWSWNVDVLE